VIRFEKVSQSGFYFPDFNLAFDHSHKEAEHVFVSHAHADHMPRNLKVPVFCTRPTFKFMRLRGYKGEASILDFHKLLDLPNIRITLYPAGHILGSAMIYIESDEGNLLYTGDCKTPPSPASEGFTMPECIDHLIIEGTFGLPVYRWKSSECIAGEIQDFVTKTINENHTPIFLAYNLGKAQEIMHLLAPLKHPVQIHKDGFKLCGIYEEEGIDLGIYDEYDPVTCEGKILIAPSMTLSNGFASGISNKRIAYCSGWASVESHRHRMNADFRIVLSDHLDFFELINLCKTHAPKKVTITHSPNPDVILHYLRNLNIDSEAV
jgi:putative mRNA 3-end processing factor